MKGVGWEVSDSLDVQQARKAGELISEVANVRKMLCTHQLQAYHIDMILINPEY